MRHQFIYWLIGKVIMVIHQPLYICKMVCHNFDLLSLQQASSGWSPQVTQSTKETFKDIKTLNELAQSSYEQEQGLRIGNFRDLPCFASRAGFYHKQASGKQNDEGIP